MDWTRGQIIGRGSSATVSIAKANGSGQTFAVKSAELSQSELLQKEQGILSKLSCPQIIAYKGYDTTNEHGKLFYNLFLEYAPGGTLIDAIHKHGGHLDETMIRSYIRAILLGLEYLHSNGIVHCDIKGHNILVTSDGAKIADLGCARWADKLPYTDRTTTTPIAGTPVYMAPEVARGEEQGFAADIWALGCTVIQMATGRAPWPNVFSPVSALYEIGFSGNVPEIPRFMSKQGKDFLGKCFKRDPKERWSASELLKHAYVTEEPNFVLKEIKSSNLDSPTSVMDQGLWDSVAELETTWNSTLKNYSDSPLQRIRKLTEGNVKVSNWVCDDTWVTVRSNDATTVQELFGSTQGHNLIVCANDPTGDSGTGPLWVCEEYILVIPDEPISISGINTTTTTSPGGSCSYSSWCKILLMPSKCTQDVICSDINLEKQMVFCFLYSSCKSCVSVWQGSMWIVCPQQIHQFTLIK